MAPTITIIRHAEGLHNVTVASTVLDPQLTTHGLQQCAQVQSSFPYKPDVILCSPLKRTIQTAIFCFGPAIWDSLQVRLLPSLQEVSDYPCNHGSTLAELKGEYGSIIDPSMAPNLTDPEWFRKGLSPDPVDVSARALEARLAIRQIAHELVTGNYGENIPANPDPHVLVVTHGDFVIWLTESFTPQYGTSLWGNTEWRSYRFKDSTLASDGNASLEETEDSLQRRNGKPLSADQQEQGKANANHYQMRQQKANNTGNITFLNR